MLYSKLSIKLTGPQDGRAVLQLHPALKLLRQQSPPDRSRALNVCSHTGGKWGGGLPGSARQ